MPRTRWPPSNWFWPRPTISSQLIDNLNASIHLRALLTDLFLFDEILKAQRKPKPTVTG